MADATLLHDPTRFQCSCSMAAKPVELGVTPGIPSSGQSSICKRGKVLQNAFVFLFFSAPTYLNVRFSESAALVLNSTILAKACRLRDSSEAAGPRKLSDSVRCKREQLEVAFTAVRCESPGALRLCAV